MEFTKDEQRLIESARTRQAPSRAGFILLLTLIGVGLMTISVIIDPGDDAGMRISQLSAWLLFGISQYAYLKFRETALDVVAKLTSTYDDREAAPRVFGAPRA